MRVACVTQCRILKVAMPHYHYHLLILCLLLILLLNHKRMRNAL